MESTMLLRCRAAAWRRNISRAGLAAVLLVVALAGWDGREMDFAAEPLLRQVHTPVSSPPLAQAKLLVGGGERLSARPIQTRPSMLPRRVFGLGTSEILVILAVGAVFFGPEALKGFAKEAGKAAGDLKDVPKAFEEGMAVAESEKKGPSKLEAAASKEEKPETTAKKAEADRRGVVGSTASVALLGLLQQPCRAEGTSGLTELLDGGVSLPDGARQEDRLRRGLEAWRKLGEKLENGQVKTDAEWDDSRGFLRRLYTLQDDMSYLARGLKAEKKKEAEELIASFKQDVKACDKPAKAKDAGKFLSYYAGTSRQIKDFLGLLVDVTEDLELEDAIPID